MAESLARKPREWDAIERVVEKRRELIQQAKTHSKEALEERMNELTKQIRDAATKVAQQKNLKLVVTTEGVGYGGVDITKDVEKAMNITDKATPAPNS